MALAPDRDTTIPLDTATLARTLRPTGSLVMSIRDTCGPLFTDAQFADLFAHTGQHALAPGRLALICVLQTIEGLSDRQAAEAVALRIDWKYALDLPLAYPGFSHTVLTDFRDRVLAGSAEDQLLTSLLTLARDHGWLDRRRQRTDSTHVLAAAAQLSRLDLVHETLHATLTALARVAPTWLQSWVPVSWYATYGGGAVVRRWPKTEPERLAIAVQIGTDGAQLLAALALAPHDASQLELVGTLRQIWQQQYHMDNEALVWRTSDELPVATERLVSPYETEARTGGKREQYWDGYKVHLTETVTDNAPQLITHVATTVASEADITTLPQIQQGLADAGLTPAEHLLDSGYVSADGLVASKTQHQIALIGPVLADHSWQTRVEGGVTMAEFRIDWEACKAYGPQGCVSSGWARQRNTRTGEREIQIRFPPAVCRACPIRAQCTQSVDNGRTLTVREQAVHEELMAARARMQTREFQEVYGKRAGIEGTLSQGVRSYGLRRSPYRGKAKTHLQQILVALAINLLRIVAWVQEIPRCTTRQNPFAALAPTPV